MLIAHVLQSLTDELPGDPATLEAGLNLGVGERHQLGCRDVVADGCQHALVRDVDGPVLSRPGAQQREHAARTPAATSAGQTTANSSAAPLTPERPVTRRRPA